MPAEIAAGRAALARAQGELLEALLGRRPAPEGFAPGHLEAAALSLSRKRAHGVRRAWPGLARALGDDAFARRFAAFAARSPLPAAGGAFADGRAFAAALARDGALPDAGALEAFSFDLVSGAALARGAPERRLAYAVLRERGRIVLGLRVPGLGNVTASIRVPRVLARALVRIRASSSA